jgi:hypothetical protein
LIDETSLFIVTSIFYSVTELIFDKSERIGIIIEFVSERIPEPRSGDIICQAFGFFS